MYSMYLHFAICVLAWALGQLWHHKLLPIIIKGAANNYEPANSLIQSLLECGFGELVVKDGSSAVRLKRRSLNDMSSDMRQFLTELDVNVGLYESSECR